MQNQIIAGFVASIVTEIFKFVPQLRANAITTAITAIVVTLVASYIAAGTFTFEGFVAAAVVALTTYTTVVQPVAKVAGLSSQA